MAGLDRYQRAAVDAPTGGLFVAAGAGTGKTRVMSHRFSRLLGELLDSSSEDPLDSLCAVTYTEKAAGELADRIRRALVEAGRTDVSRRADAAWVHTIHGLCGRLLRRHAFDAGVDPGFSVADQVVSRALSREAFDEIAGACAAEDERVEALLERYGFEDVERAVSTAYERSRSLGFAPVLAVRDGRLAGRLAEELVALGVARAELARTAERGRARDNLEAVDTLLETLRDLEPTAVGTPETVLAAVAVTRVKAGVCAASAEASRVAADAVARVGALVAEELAGRDATALEALLVRYAARVAELKGSRGLLDFEDLQLEARRLLDENPDIAEGYRRTFDEVMVDEFQDANRLQLTILEGVAGERLATVGDDKQAIYGFRNADVRIFLERAAEKGAKRLPLSANYRSHQVLLDFFNGLFGAEPFWPGDFAELEFGTREKPGDEEGPWPAGEPRLRVDLVDTGACGEIAHAEAEAALLADRLVRLHDEGVPWGDMAVLLRFRKRGQVFERALKQRGARTYLAAGGSFHEALETEELAALMRVVANAEDDAAFARLLAGRLGGLTSDGLLALRQLTPRGTSLWDGALDRAREPLPEADEVALLRIVSVLEDLRRDRGRLPLYDLIHRACERLDHDLTLFAAGDPRGWANAMKLARAASAFELVSAGDSGVFLEHLDHLKSFAREEGEAVLAAEGVDAVRIMTIHGAKGLEFPVVAVADLGSDLGRGAPDFLFEAGTGALSVGVRLPGRIPTADHERIKEDQAARGSAEEKRIFYVACTRASRALLLSGAVDAQKAADTTTAAGWLREALGTSKPYEAGESRIRVGSAEVTFAVTGPPESCGREPVPDAPPSPDGAGLAFPPLPENEAPSERPDRVSFSSMQTYLSCPYRYYASYLARLSPAAVRCTDDAHGDARDEATAGDVDARAFGRAVHEVLSRSTPGSPPSAEALLAAAETERLAESQLERMGRAVSAALASPRVRAAYDSSVVMTEAPIAVLLGSVVLEGSLDLYGRSAASAIIVDYKTGATAPDEATRDKYRAQADCYALAVLEDGAERVEAAFVHPEQDGLEIRFEYGAADAGRLRTELGGIVDRIVGGDFSHLEQYDAAVCAECPALGGLCPIDPPGDEG